MNLYVISEIGYMYNDKNYVRPEADAGIPIKAFKTKKNAEEEVKRLNREKKYTPNENPATEFYTVAEVEVADEDVETYANAKDNAQEAFKVRQKAAQKEFKAGAKELFKAHPKLKSFGWKQYTPYFNDGAPCEFNAYMEDPIINGVEDLESGERWSSKTGKIERFSEPSLEYTLLEPVKKFLEQFEAADFLYLFGDHCQVTVPRRGKIMVEEYTHD